MEVLILLALLTLLIITITGSNRMQSRLQELTEELNALRREVKQAGRTEEKRELSKEETKPRPIIPDTRWAPKPDLPMQEELIPEPQPPIPKPEQLPQVKVPIPRPAIVFPPSPPLSLPPPARPGFFERNPDLEKFIGENLISKIGIAILVIAIGFFVKYAIDKDWIGPAGRAGIGVLCGGILIGLAHRMQRNYKAFSSVLVGGGLAVLYFSIALAYKDYALFSQAAAFVIMVVITIFAILLSLLYDRQEVAIIALVGGFAVPFLVSDGSGNYVMLFSYLLVLNTGLLVIAYRKAWRLLNFIAFAATMILYGGWVTTLERGTPPATFIGGLLFATAFYLLFLAINLAHNIREQKKFIASDFGIILANNALYFSAGLYLLYAGNATPYKGLFCAALGVLNFVLAFVLVRRKNIDKSILYLLVGVTLTFVSLTAPLQLNGHFITLFWAAESVVLLWLFQKSGIRVLQWGLLAIWVCSLISLFMDWNAVYGNPQAAGGLLPIVFNRGFITTLFVAGANAMLFRLMRGTANALPFNAFEPAIIRRISGGTALVLLFVSGAAELVYQFNTRYPGITLSLLYLQLYTGVFVGILWQVVRRGWLRLPRLLCLLLMAAGLLFYLVAAPLVYAIQEQVLSEGRYHAHFIAHWLGAAVTAILFCQLIMSLRARQQTAAFHNALTWGAGAFAVVFVSVELHLLTNVLAFGSLHSLDEISRHYVQVGLPIIWGLCSFAFMWLGMRHKYRPLRIVSLTLFSITLLKLFLFDIRGLGAAGKIAAFFSLGVLLLIVSFMYQRLKRLIIEDERKDDAQ